MIKDKKHKSQKAIISEYCERHVETAAEISKALNIPRGSTAKAVYELRHSGQLIELFRAWCPLTRRKAAYLTTNIHLINRLNGMVRIDKGTGSGRGTNTNHSTNWIL
jgi:hypothetical protein